MTTIKKFSMAALGAAVVTLVTGGSSQAASLINLDFNSPVDSAGNSQGDLVFEGLNGFQVTFTDDESSGTHGGNASGVHITNRNYGNIKVGSQTDLVLGAFNRFRGSNNYHSSGIVAHFNQGVELVKFLDADDDHTTKTLFAFDENGALIGQTNAATQIEFVIDTSITGGKLIHAVEFDTQAGPAGGSFDGTVFTIDNFSVEGTPTEKKSVPEPSALLGLLTFGAAGSLLKRKP